MIKTICVDPGHGMSNRRSGRYDPGAIHDEDGVRFEEATIALKYGLTLRDELRSRGLTVFMTRDDATDHAPVGQRAANAKKMGCEMLISLHLNDFDDDSANGGEVLYGDLPDKALAERLQTALLSVTGLRDRKVKHRPDLAVLKFAGPAALIELGFIANDRDRQVLLNPVTRVEVCRAIADVVTA